jgi:hypothetical protein
VHCKAVNTDFILTSIIAYVKVSGGKYEVIIGDATMIDINRISGKAPVGDGVNEPNRGASTARC